MRRLGVFLLGTVLSFSQILYAQQISESEAKDKALSFFNSRPSIANDGARRTPARGGADANVQLAYKATDGTNNFFYVYNNGENDGFVIIGGDAVAHEILAYVPQGHFNYDSIPDNVKWWLGEYAKEISVVKKMKPQTRPTSAPNRTTQLGNTPSVQDLFTDIPDLITTKWNQREPYNKAIPAIHYSNGDSVIPPTGCLPTALAQIMNYWQWPTTGVGSYSYTVDYSYCGYDGLLPATFSADFGNTTYDWANMADKYYMGTNSQAQIDAVSTLMYHVGVADRTQYTPDGSGAPGTEEAMNALKQYFGYSDRIKTLYRHDYLDDEWEEIIYYELLAGRPVYYESHDESDGHAFILHGYSANYKMFSVNWGWGGNWDGYFKITGTNYAYFVNDENYKVNDATHAICIRIEPNNITHSNSFSNVGDTIVVNGIRYDLIGPLSKTVEITFAPNNPFFYKGELTIPETIVYNGETYTVTKIGNSGLSGRQLEKLHLPNTLRSIARRGISGQEAIKELQLPESVEMIGSECFLGMENLITITLPGQLPYIPKSCFGECHRLKTVTLPSSIQALGEYSFWRCTSLDLLISKAVKVPAHYTYHELFDLDLSGKVLAVPQEAIDDYKNDPEFGRWGRIVSLDSISAHFGELITIDDVQYEVLAYGNTMSSVGYVGNRKDTLIIPSSVVYDGVKYSVKKIEHSAFEQLNKVSTITIEEGMEEIGINAFRYSRISSVCLPSTLRVIQPDAFGECNVLKSVYLPNGITTINSGAFQNCSQMKSFEMPNSVVNIGDIVFTDCNNLEYIKLSSSLTELTWLTFAGTKIKSICIPSGVTYLGDGTFSGCNSLKAMICYAKEVPRVRGDDIYPIFPSNIAQGTLYVPAGSVSAYQSAPGWQNWGTILPIVPVDSIHLDNISIEKNAFDTITIQVFPSNVTAGQIFYSSSNPKIAKIDHNGIITTVGPGEATITAETMDGKTATCTVTVTSSRYITVTSSDETMGTVTGSGKYEYGSNVTIKATPNDGYVFSKWNDDNTDSERVITVVDNVTYTAYFAPANETGLNTQQEKTEVKIKIFDKKNKIIILRNGKRFSITGVEL